MKKHFKKTTAILLVLLMVTTTISALPFTASATEESVVTATGITGDCTWQLEENGTLTISGNGAMERYIPRCPAPWSNLRFNKVVIEDGVTSIGNHAFSNSKMTNITIPNSVKSIGKFAFLSCTNLTSVIIPDGVTTIEEGVFYDCELIGSIVLPDTLISIDYCAFKDCKILTSITIPDCVTSISDNAFDGCKKSITIYGKINTYAKEYANKNDIPFTDKENNYSSGKTGECKWTLEDGTLTISGNGAMGDYVYLSPWAGSNCCEAIIEEGVTTIGKNAFYYCNYLTDITISDSVTKICKGAFDNCTRLTNITIPDSVKIIGDNAFEHCLGLTSIVIPDSVTSIGDEAFSGCSGLNSIDIPNSVTSIGYSAFYGCSGLTSIVIPDSVTSVGDCAFAECNLTNITVSEENQKYDSRNNCNAIIETGNNTLISGCKNTVVSDGVTSIGEGAFFGCSGLTSIDIPNSVTSISDRAFFRCTKLANITMPNSVTSIDDYAFYQCTNLASIDIPNSVTSIGIYAFYQCTNLASITIPNSVTSIGNYTFYQCTNLSNITIPNSVTSIGDYAFYQCTNLSNLTIPNSVTSIGNYTFANCNLTYITVSEENKKYDSRNNCNAIIETGNNTLISGCKNTVVPDGVTSISNGAFYGCSGLTSIDIPNSVTSIGNSAFYGCSGLTSIDIPNSVTSIGDRAFYGCSGLTSIDIPNSVTSIGDYAFYQCIHLATIIVPDSVISIGSKAFENTEWQFNQSDEIVYAGKVVCDYTGEMQEHAFLRIRKGTVGIAVGALSNCEKVEEIEIPDTVQIISSGAFFGCDDLKSINIPSSVTKIGDYAFANCPKLESITIPPSVKSIGKKAFGFKIKENVKVESKNIGKIEEIVKDEDFEQNDVFTIKVKENSEAYNYANNNGLSYETIKYEFEWGKDNWNFNNEKTNFQTDSLNESIINTLVDYFNMNEGLADNIRMEDVLADSISQQIYDNAWHGECFGMTVAEILVKQGLLNLDNDGNPKTSLNDNELKKNLFGYSINDNIRTLIRFLQELQCYGKYSQTYRAEAVNSEGSSQENTGISQKNLIKTAENELKNQDSVILIDYEYYDSKINGKNKMSEHAVLGYGIENCEYTSPINGKTYYNRILIADPNFLSTNVVDDDACIYYNNDGSWICPYRNNDTESCYYNSDNDYNYKGNIKYLLRYNSLTDPEFYPKYSSYIAGMTIFNNSKNTPEASNMVEYTFYGIPEYRKLYALKNSSEECSFSYSEPTVYSMMMDYEKISYYTYVENGRSTTAYPNGSINLTGENANYSLTIVENESENDWFSLTVSGTNADDITLSKYDNGYLLKSTNKNLNDIKVTWKDRSKSTIITRNYPGEIECKSVLIYIDNNKIGIKVKIDNDSDYETDLLVRGDMDGDCSITILDATYIQNYLAGFNVNCTDKQITASDANNNDAIDIGDATFIQQYLAGLKNEYVSPGGGLKPLGFVYYNLEKGLRAETPF